MMDFWQERLRKRQENDLWRDPPMVSNRHLATLDHSGTTWLDFSSNDALALAQEELTLSSASGSGASRLVTGNQEVIVKSEKALAEWMGFEDALLFPSGWQANVSLLSGLFTKEDVVLSDELNHASIVDGLRLSGCQKVIFKHRDLDDLGTKLQQNPQAKALVIESLYSVDGHFFPLDDLFSLIRNREILLIVDEAHAAGIYGCDYEGQVARQGDHAHMIKIVTCSKALGAQGGAVLSSSELRAYLMNVCRGFIFSTGVSPFLAEILSHRIATLPGASLGQEKLIDLSNQFYDLLGEVGASVISDRGSHIVAIEFDSHGAGRRAWEELKKEKIWCAFLRYPTVPQGKSRLRFSLTVHHTKDHLDQVVEALSQFFRP